MVSSLSAGRLTDDALLEMVGGLECLALMSADHSGDGRPLGRWMVWNPLFLDPSTLLRLPHLKCLFACLL